MSTLTAEQVEGLKKAATKGLLGNYLRNHSVSFTGTLSMRREDLVELLRAVGGRWDERVNYYTNFLVVGDTGRFGETKKIHDARMRGTTIVTEEEFVAMLLKKR